jgi:signal peptidase
MEPALKVGGLILCRQVPVEEVEVGDIIGFNTPGGQKVTHRVIEITESDGKRWFRTKGDANEDPDPDVFTIPGGKVDRVVFHLPYAGYVSSFLNSKAGFFIFIVVPGVILLSLFGYDLWKAAVEIRKGRAGEKRDGG